LNRSPGATKSVATPFGWGLAVDGSSDGESSSTRPSWRINITEIPVADATYPNGSTIPNAKIVNTVYDFSYESNESIPEALATAQQEATPNNSTSMPYLCATIFSSFFPANVTNAINSTSSGSACSPAIGEACLTAILQSASTSGSSIDQCKSFTSPNTLPECLGSFTSNTQTTALLSDPGSGTSNGTSSYPLHSGTSFWYQSSEAHDGSDSMFFDQQDLRMHMMIVQTPDLTYSMCTRVNASVDASGLAEGASTVEEGAAGKAVIGSMSTLLVGLAVALGIAL
jgi:hypothetical protein